MNESVVSIVIPVFNEEGNITHLYERLKKITVSRSEDFEFIFINDGSSDSSIRLLTEIARHDNHAKVIDFSRNFGHQLAVTAGLDFCRGGCAVIIDADLQDPPELIEQMLEKWYEGYDVVYAQRKSRKGESVFKRISASVFYRLLHRLTDVDIPLDTGDFRLISRKVIEALKNMPERHRFLRGMISWSGFRQTGLEYVREERYSGKTKYPLLKMFRFALTGITSFSFVPLQIASYFGFTVSALSFLYAVYVIYLRIFTNETIQGWTSLMIAVLFLGGIQLITLGIIGEYIGRISDEVKQRPAYIIRNKINID
jgi:glycosyltransferase involved in cell wall biosynthesis